MVDDSALSAGARFADDLRRIRIDRDVSLDAVHKATRVAKPLLQSFESTALLDHPAFNRVYLRSLVRAYAETIDIAPEHALDALDAVEHGTYTNALAAVYLSESADVPSPPDASDAAPDTPPGPASPDDTAASPLALRPDLTPHDEDLSAGDLMSADITDAPPPAPDPETTPAPPPQTSAPGVEETMPDASEDAPEDEDEPEDEEGSDGTTAASDVSSTEPPSADHSHDETDEERRQHEAAKVHPEQAPRAANASSVASPARRERPASASTASSAWDIRRLSAIVGGVLVVIALVVFFWQDDDDTPPGPAPSSTASATAPAPAVSDTASVASEPPLSPITLGDTLYLTVVAEAPVAGVRIRRDDDLRRPYWIEEGEASVFPFQSRIAVEQQLTSLRLALNGYPYPIRDSDGVVIISRDSAEAFADTLRADPAVLPSARDTLSIPASAPSPPSPDGESSSPSPARPAEADTSAREPVTGA